MDYEKIYTGINIDWNRVIYETLQRKRLLTMPSILIVH